MHGMNNRKNGIYRSWISARSVILKTQ